MFVTALEAPESWDDVLRRTDILAVIEARIAIECEAAALAAERHTPADMVSIRLALTARDEKRSEIESHVDADTAFHRAVVAAAHNPILLDLFDSFTPRLRGAMVEMLRLRSAFGSDEDHAVHRDLVEAIARRDAAVASAMSRTHLDSLRSALG